MMQPVALARALRALAAAALCALCATGCYDVPQPQCGFRCGPGGECPENYTCNAADGRCHHETAPASLVCGTVDASIDALRDAALEDAPDAF
jgi:hypothetical protein